MIIINNVILILLIILGQVFGQTQPTILNTAYELIQTNPQESIILFNKYLESDPENINVLKDKAYLLLKIGRKKDAVETFEQILKLSSQEEKVVLQLGYLYDEIGKKHLAYKIFKNLENSKDENISTNAKNAIKYLYPWRFFKFGFFIESDTETFATEFRNMNIFYTRFLTALRLTPKNSTDIYFNFRYFNQSGIDSGFMPPSFNDTISIFAFGIRKWFSEKIGIVGYTEVGIRNNDLISNYKEDFSCGIAIYNEWKDIDLSKKSYKLRLFSFLREANLYADIGYFSRAENDIITYFRYNEFMNLFFYKNTVLDIYGSVIAAYDKNGFYYYRYSEGCIGIRILPYKKYKLTFFAELTKKYFLDTEKIDLSSIPNNYNDKKIGLRTFFSF